MATPVSPSVLKIGGFVGDAGMGLTACGGASRGVGRQDEVAKRGQHSNEVELAWMNCGSIIRSFVTATSKTIQPTIFYVPRVESMRRAVSQIQEKELAEAVHRQSVQTKPARLEIPQGGR